MHHGRGRPPDPLVHPTRTPGRARSSRLIPHVVTAQEAGLRCDVAVARLAGASRAAVALALRAGSVRLNGSVPKPSAALTAGDLLEFEIAPPTPLDAVAQPLPLSVLYEDDSLLVVDKAAGVITHPAHGARAGTLVNAVLAHVGTLPGDPLRPGLVHRLDRDTSGLIVIAKTEKALHLLGKAMMRRAIEREYLGLVVGVPQSPKGTLEGPIGRDPANRLKFAVQAEGKPAVTHYELREALGRHAELVFRLETGRTHQIRVHMAAFRHPIVNDPLYGKRDERLPLAGQALHAWRLRFRHPSTGEPLVFEAEPPPAYVCAREILRA